MLNTGNIYKLHQAHRNFKGKVVEYLDLCTGPLERLVFIIWKPLIQTLLNFKEYELETYALFDLEAFQWRMIYCLEE